MIEILVLDPEIYHEDDMETPVFEKTAEKTRLAMPAGKLKEGTYFWYQAAWDAAGKEMVASQMNKLSPRPAPRWWWARRPSPSPPTDACSRPSRESPRAPC